MGVAPVRKIIHIDMDAFFASVEQRDAPELRGRPVAVGYAAARGVVAAASYEARTFGVRSALPSVTALRRCPELVFVKPRFEVYKEVSQQIHAIFADYTELIQPLSLDEAYLDVTEPPRNRDRLGDRQGDPRAHPGGDRAHRLGGDLVQQVPRQARLGPAQAQRPVRRDARDGRGLGGDAPGQALPRRRPGDRGEDAAAGDRDRRGPARQVARLPAANFGNAAEWYHAIARGRTIGRSIPSRERKSSGSETTFDRDLTEPAEIEAGVLRMADDVWAWCDKAQAFGRTVTVKVKFADFQQITRSRSFPEVIATHDALNSAAQALIRSVLPAEKGIRLVGVTVSNFEAVPASDALPLFGDTPEPAANRPTGQAAGTPPIPCPAETG
jgi:DNA polymerase-4